MKDQIKGKQQKKKKQKERKKKKQISLDTYH